MCHNRIEPFPLLWRQIAGEDAPGVIAAEPIVGLDEAQPQGGMALAQAPRGQGAREPAANDHDVEWHSETIIIDFWDFYGSAKTGELATGGVRDLDPDLVASHRAWCEWSVVISVGCLHV